ncbi:Y-family DNA polymerase [Lacticaseibacillus thailandensis]|uniref:Nucleotidyltransferase DNA polymerase for DNA repair n=1 Tax=Lacticaseibacillus thailandensis DSM 22698 = JCM 13996 TaxID=1423810 RepID=A0A0R2CBB6_9LACO|nr:Y-family DNA polymerase [Lacticaseibacillus thailandensis]KRM87332.1 nucleotidyltransferase DNA polymerase for DNA repair [Lacticaseibacillus thailandensis DSM 22698 = JCM 13996]
MDYQYEPHGVFFLIDSRSFYASAECVVRDLHPLKTALVVMSEQENTNGGLILATSPRAKEEFHLQANVSRQRDLPQSEDLIVVPPRMNMYIQKNLQINQIFQRYVAPADIWPYSIDESILNLTHSWRLFGPNPWAVARQIQRTIHDETGIYTAVGIGNNPLQAKIALDIYAKHQYDLIAEINYQNIPQQLWTITNMEDVWSIGKRTANHLRRIGINNMWELAHANPYALRAEFGLIGEQLYALAWGIDRAHPGQVEPIKSPSISNSQVLPRDYIHRDEIRLVVKEIGEQVAARLRHRHLLCHKVSLGIGFNYATATATNRGGFGAEITVSATNSNHAIAAALLRIFDHYWDGEGVRNIAVSCGQLGPDNGQQLELFQPVKQQIQDYTLERTVDAIRSRFGFTALVYAKSKLTGGTAINRANLVGGHNGGNSYE